MFKLIKEGHKGFEHTDTTNDQTDA